MAQVKIVCDASYNEKLRLTGYGGLINISDRKHRNQSYMYQGVAGELTDIQEGELVAILAGLNELSRRESLSQLSVGQVQIITDSKSAVKGLFEPASATSLNRDKYLPLYEKINEVISRNNWTASVEHVNSHVPVEQATGLERLNHIADERASQMRKAVLKNILAPDASHSRAVTLLLPQEPKNKAELESWKMIAHEMVSQNRHVRLHIPDATRSVGEHPFVQSMALAASEQGEKVSSFLTYYPESPGVAYSGLDYTLLRYHALQQGHDTDFSITGKSPGKQAALASLLLYGKPYEFATNMTHPSGRVKPASYRVYDLLNPLPKNSPRPQTVQGYISTFLDYVSIPKIEGLEAVMRDLNMVVGHSVKSRKEQAGPQEYPSTNVLPDDALKADLKAVFQAYEKQLSPEQMSAALVDVIVSHGSLNNDLFRRSMDRFIRISYTNDPETLINKITSHAKRLDPSLQAGAASKQKAKGGTPKPFEDNAPSPAGADDVRERPKP